MRYSLTLLGVVALLASASLARGSSVRTLNGEAIDPLRASSKIEVLIFARTDCPITRRYAPELQRIAQEFASRPVAFWLVFPDPSESPDTVAATIADFHFPGTPLLDPKHQLVRRARATVAPEVAVFDPTGRLAYHGRIDDRYVDFGKYKPAHQVHDLEQAIRATLAGNPIERVETRAIGCALADVE